MRRIGLEINLEFIRKASGNEPVFTYIPAHRAIIVLDLPYRYNQEYLTDDIDQLVEPKIHELVERDPLKYGYLKGKNWDYRWQKVRSGTIQ